MTVRDSLLVALDSVTSSCNFGYFSRLESIDPGISIPSIGPVQLPLQPADAERIIGLAHQAPFGKGTQTVVDTSVRNTYELDRSQFSVGPAWNYIMAQKLQAVAQELGVQAAIHADPYKMLIYQPGAMFKPHTDTEKIPGMFGTLVVSLPSAHEGGDLVLTHRGDKMVFQTSGTPNTSFLAWYSDVMHEVLPVKSGYRFALTYNLAIDTSLVARPSAGLVTEGTHDLKDALRRWSEDEDAVSKDCLYHLLDFSYSEANISRDNLKGNDLGRIDALTRVTAELPFEVFLATLVKEQFGSVEFDYDDVDSQRGWYDDEEEEVEDDGGNGHHTLDDIHETKYEILSLTDLTGRELQSHRNLELDNALQADPFDGVDIYEEDYEGYQGNSVS